ncbi:hypothetical protein QBC46DRAFT_23392, partial [Diplogelasinospora grovesii]
ANPTNPGAGGGITPTVVTVAGPSGSPIVVTIPGSAGPGASPTNQAGGSTITESVASITPTVETITESLVTPTGGSGAPVITVSEATLTETVPLGNGQSTVVVFTTQLTVGATPGGASPAVSTLSVSPVVVTVTLSGAYGLGSTVVTYTTDVPVSPTGPEQSVPGNGGNGGAPMQTQSPQVITVWPSGGSGPLSPSGVGSPMPSVMTIWPSTTMFATPLVSPSTSCTLDNDNSAGVTGNDPGATQVGTVGPSEITIWPASSIDTTCTTLSTVYRSSIINGSPNPFGAGGPSQGTMWPAASGSGQLNTALSTPCTEESPSSSSVIVGLSTPVIVEPSSAVTPASNPTPASEPNSPPATPSAAEPSDVMPPPQTELHHHVQTPAATLSDDPQAIPTADPANPIPQMSEAMGSSAVAPASSVGGYAFTSPAGYGNPVPAYGNPTAVSVSAYGALPLSQTNGALPFSQTALSSANTAAGESVTGFSTQGPVASSAVTATASLSPAVPDQSATGASGLTTAAPAPLGSGSPFSNSTSLASAVLPTGFNSTAAPILTSALTPAPPATSLASAGPINSANATASSFANATAISTPTAAPAASNSTNSPMATSPSLNATASSTALGMNATFVPRSSPVMPVATCGTAGDRGEVVFTFDDVPNLSTTNVTGPITVQAQPVPFPYHRFFFSSGFHVVPSQASRYSPSSGNQLAFYNASAASDGQIGLGPLSENSCFRFDFLGISLGCNSIDQPCIFNVTGLYWDGTTEAIQASRTFEIAPCSEPANCTLRYDGLDSAAAEQFTNLTAVNIALTVAGQPQSWWCDDFQIAWTDNACTAAACRSRVPNTATVPHHRSWSRAVRKAKGFLRWAVHN